MNKVDAINQTRNHATYARIAEASYDFGKKNKTVGKAIRNDEYTTSKDNGFQGCVYELGDTVIVAYRGSDQGSIFDGKLDWFSNSQMAKNEIPEQYNDALELYQKAASDPKYKDKKFIVTGHSLGGSLAELVSGTTALGEKTPNAITFNSFGTTPIVNNSNGRLKINNENTNYYIKTDKWIGAVRDHNGMDISLFPKSKNPDAGKISFGKFTISGTDAHSISHFTKLKNKDYTVAYLTRNNKDTNTTQEIAQNKPQKILTAES